MLWPGGERGYTGAERGGRAGGRPELGGPRWSKGGLWDRPKDAPPASGPRPCTWPGASSWLRLPAKPWLYLVPHTAPQGIGLYCPLSRRRPSPRGPACPGAGVLLVDGSRVQAPPGAQPKPGSVPSRCCPPGLGRSREDNGPSQLLLSPHEGASQAPAPPALVGGPPRPAGSSCRPRPRPQAHLLPGQPLSVLPTPDLLAYFPSLARHNPASLARRPPLQVGCPTVFPRGYPLRSGGGQRAGELFTGTVSHGWRVWASRQSLLVHLGTPNILTS